MGLTHLGITDVLKKNRPGVAPDPSVNPPASALGALPTLRSTQGAVSPVEPQRCPILRAGRENHIRKILPNKDKFRIHNDRNHRSPTYRTFTSAYEQDLYKCFGQA